MTEQVPDAKRPGHMDRVVSEVVNELLVLALAVALVEALDAATGVDQLLLAGEERVALVAQLDLQDHRRGWSG